MLLLLLTETSTSSHPLPRHIPAPGYACVYCRAVVTRMRTEANLLTLLNQQMQRYYDHDDKNKNCRSQQQNHQQHRQTILLTGVAEEESYYFLVSSWFEFVVLLLSTAGSKGKKLYLLMLAIYDGAFLACSCDTGTRIEEEFV